MINGRKLTQGEHMAGFERALASARKRMLPFG